MRICQETEKSLQSKISIQHHMAGSAAIFFLYCMRKQHICWIWWKTPYEMDVAPLCYYKWMDCNPICIVWVSTIHALLLLLVLLLLAASDSLLLHAQIWLSSLSDWPGVTHSWSWAVWAWDIGASLQTYCEWFRVSFYDSELKVIFIGFVLSFTVIWGVK